MFTKTFIGQLHGVLLTAIYSKDSICALTNTVPI